MDLLEWSKHHIKYKDCIKRQIKNIEEKDNKLIVHEKKLDKIYCITEDLKEKLLTKNTCEGRKYIITLNKKENVNFLAENWKLVESEDLTIIFANPKTNENWMIHLMTHSKISETKNIKQGLNALYENISAC